MDKLGKPFYGYSEAYDEIIDIYSIRIQKPNSIANRGFLIAVQSYEGNEIDSKDEADILLSKKSVEGKPLIIRKSFNSEFYLKLLTKFSENGCFDKIIDYIKNNIDKLSFKSLVRYLSFLEITIKVLHKSYMNSTISPFVEFLVDYFSNIRMKNEQIQEIISYETYIEIFNKLHTIMQRAYTKHTRNELEIKLKINIAANIINNCTIAEHQKIAIKIIGELCKNMNSLCSRGLCYSCEGEYQQEEIIKACEKHKIITEILSKIINPRDFFEECADFIKLLITHNKFKESDFILFWDYCKNDDLLKLLLLKLISDNESKINSNMYSIILNKYSTIPKFFYEKLGLKLFSNWSTEDCAICFNNKREVYFAPCGHCVVCKACAKKIDKCPIDRIKIEEIQNAQFR